MTHKAAHTSMQQHDLCAETHKGQMNDNKTTAANAMESPAHKITGVPEGPVQMLLEDRRNTMKSVCTVYSAHLQGKQYVTHDFHR